MCQNLISKNYVEIGKETPNVNSLVSSLILTFSLGLGRDGDMYSPVLTLFRLPTWIEH